MIWPIMELLVLKLITSRDGYPCPRPYTETQEKAFCLLHANMAMGTYILSGNSVFSHVWLLEHTLTVRNLAHISLRHFYTRGIGKFDITFVNHYLHYLPCKSSFSPALHPALAGLQRGQINRCLVEHLSRDSACASAIILITIMVASSMQR